MAAHTGQPTHSRRFIKVYLGTWGLLAVGALSYLAMLAYPPQTDAPEQAAVEAPQVAVVPAPAAVGPRRVEVEPRRVPVAPVRVAVEPPANDAPASGAVAETGASSSETGKDAPASKDAAGERAGNEKVAYTRQLAQEEPAPTTAAPPAPPTVPGITVLDKPEDRVANKAADKAAPASGEATPDDADKAQETAAAPPPAAPPLVPIETGSIAPNGESIAPQTASAMPKEKIVFGEPVVTRTRPEFAVQLGAGSLPALRRSWGQLAERHAAALGSLQPRVVAPLSGSSLYRLLAGPVPSLAEAQRICTELGVGPEGCYATYYAGAPL